MSRRSVIFVVSVKLVRQTVIHVGVFVLLSSLGDRAASLVSQVVLQDDGISGVAFVHRVGEISDERYEADDKVQQYVHCHLHAE